MWKLPNFKGRAKKLRGSGYIEYCLWFDDNGNAYIQIVNNENSGTYPNLLFSVSKYAPSRDKNEGIEGIEGIDPKTRIPKSSNNENDSGFIKAILRDLLS